MTQEYKVGNIKNQLQLFLNAQARKSAFLSAPLILKTEFKNTPYVSDSSKKLFSINMAHLISFRDYFNDKSYKNIRLYDWEFNLKFNGKRCTSIELESQHIALIASKNIIKQIKDCTFSLEIANQSDIQELDQNYKGYLNRLGKRNLVANSQYVAEQYHNLVMFIKKPLNYSAVQKICMPVPKTQSTVQPLTFLNQRGKDLLQKLRHFITKQDLLNFMVEQQLSEQGEKQMRRLILSEAMGGNKKKAVYTRSIIESLQKNIIQ